MDRTTLTHVVSSFVVLVLGTQVSEASPFTVELLSTQYRTHVSTTITSGGIDTSRTTLDDTPLSDSMAAELPLGPVFSAKADAWASADMFDLAVETQGRIGQADAEAGSTLTFSSAANAVGSLDISLFGSGQYVYSQGAISLFDVTAGLMSWTYSWSVPNLSGNVPWTIDPFLSLGAASFTAATELLAGHTYTLTTSVGVHANSDAQRITMQVAGLDPTRVPEPGVLSLFGCGAISVVMLAVRRRRGSIRASHL